MSIELPNLPCAYEALEPLIFATMLRTHQGKHHRAYVDKVNVLVSGTDLAGSLDSGNHGANSRKFIDYDQ